MTKMAKVFGIPDVSVQNKTYFRFLSITVSQFRHFKLKKLKHSFLKTVKAAVKISLKAILNK